MNDHYVGLFAAYGSMVVLTVFVSVLLTRKRTAEPIWPAQETVRLPRPWLDLGLFFVAVVGVIAVGQLYQRGLMLPTRGPAGWLLEAVNHAAIFAPILILLAIRRQGLGTVLLPGGRLWLRLAAGCGLALVAAGAYVLAGPSTVSDVAGAIADEARDGVLLGHAVQVFMEDLAIAALLVRLAAALRSGWAAGVCVAVLFSAAHIPAMLGSGDPVTATDFLHRGFDAAIGVIVMVGLIRTRDVLWLYPTHLLMDLTQFAA